MERKLMQAVVLRSPRVLELVEAPLPALTAENHVLIEVKACGICGSDLRYWAGENPWALHTLGYHVDNPPNIILGHEFAGIVAAVNSAQYEHLLGKRVGVQAYRGCGMCDFCRTGRLNLCKQTVHFGHGQGWGKMDLYPGAYAEYSLAWGDLLYPMPDDVSFADAAMGDILCVAVHVAGRALPKPGADVLCMGGGPIGLSVAQVAKAKGARRVFVCETSPLARRILEQFELTVIDPERESPRDVIAAAAGRPAVSVVYDSVGTDETMNAALPLVEESGTYVNFAVHSTSWKLNAAALGSERTITTASNALYRDVREGYDLIFSGQVRVAPMISHRFPLNEYQRAFDLLLSVPKRAYKVVFEPG